MLALGDDLPHVVSQIYAAVRTDPIVDQVHTQLCIEKVAGEGFEVDGRQGTKVIVRHTITVPHKLAGRCYIPGSR
ncbi:hypothetical protein GCM10023171_24320 [Microbacterium panaciterrae]|uniref:Uncharacterized protein n=1 Tax=Microbacterium panaciterrae TaxID=985759 RepID=A0ABP8PJS8_9MICO